MKKIIIGIIALTLIGCRDEGWYPSGEVRIEHYYEYAAATGGKQLEVSNDFTSSAFAEDDLFVSVNADPLTNEQTQAVEGEGAAGAIGRAMLGAGGLGYIGLCI
jgi:hypothetical protein